MKRKTAENTTAALGIFLSGALLGFVVSDLRKTNPLVKDNQQIVYHSVDSGSGGGLSRKNYTILTDLDGDGDWDLAERVYEGPSDAESTRKLYFKKGHGPAQSINAEVEFVEPEFFDALDGRSRREDNWYPQSVFIGPCNISSDGKHDYIMGEKRFKYDANGKLISVKEIE